MEERKALEKALMNHEWMRDAPLCKCESGERVLYMCMQPHCHEKGRVFFCTPCLEKQIHKEKPAKKIQNSIDSFMTLWSLVRERVSEQAHLVEVAFRPREHLIRYLESQPRAQVPEGYRSLSADVHQALALLERVKAESQILEGMVVSKQIEPFLAKIQVLDEVQTALNRLRYLETLSLDDVFLNFLGLWDQDMTLPVRALSTEDNMALLSFKLRALQGHPRPPVRLLDVDDSVRV